MVEDCVWEMTVARGSLACAHAWAFGELFACHAWEIRGRRRWHMNLTYIHRGLYILNRPIGPPNFVARQSARFHLRGHGSI